MTNSLLLQASSVLTAFEGLSRSASDYQELSAAELLELSTITAAINRHSGTHSALVAGDIARRSAHVLGHDGLARRAGFRSPEELLRSTGATATEASRAVRVGALLHDTQPWMQPVADALSDGSLSPAAADSIRAGLGEPTTDISSELLADAADQLCLESAALDPDRLHKRARELRDDLDEAGIADREAARHAQRSLRFTKLSDGMSLLTWRLDPESAAAVGELYNRATSPRLGGPRFTKGDNAELADRILDDPRSTEQLASDTFLELLRQGSAADSSQLLSTGAPVVRIVVAQPALESREGHGWIEGEHDPISIETVERLACGGAEQIATFDSHGQPLDLGREQRLFSARQRIALAIRDGGCVWFNCGRPPSWTEAHHVQFWKRDKGKTDIENGILLCKFHHLELHNNHWDIIYKNGAYYLVPPAKLDPTRTPRRLETKSRVMRDLAG
jgi:hypothetical protein